MKLRIKGASLRLRLTQGEVRRLEQEGSVEEAVPFAGGARLRYRLCMDPQVTQPSAAYAADVLTVWLPRPAALQWCAGTQTTLAHDQAVADGVLRIVVEKDFACLTAREGEDESDNFPHPRGP
ncbi:MAG: hypothetical protein JSR67_03025 [Proteobacteria bacterium]|nr:hypothetical protein [Pseudomonadota bacterium]